MNRCALCADLRSAGAARTPGPAGAGYMRVPAIDARLRAAVAAWSNARRTAACAAVCVIPPGSALSLLAPAYGSSCTLLPWPRVAGAALHSSACVAVAPHARAIRCRERGRNVEPMAVLLNSDRCAVCSESVHGEIHGYCELALRLRISVNTQYWYIHYLLLHLSYRDTPA